MQGYVLDTDLLQLTKVLFFFLSGQPTVSRTDEMLQFQHGKVDWILCVSGAKEHEANVPFANLCAIVQEVELCRGGCGPIIGQWVVD